MPKYTIVQLVRLARCFSADFENKNKSKKLYFFKTWYTVWSFGELIILNDKYLHDIHLNLRFSQSQKAVHRIIEIKKLIFTSLKQVQTSILHPCNALALKEDISFYLRPFQSFSSIFCSLCRKNFFFLVKESLTWTFIK